MMTKAYFAYLQHKYDADKSTDKSTLLSLVHTMTAATIAV